MEKTCRKHPRQPLHPDRGCTICRLEHAEKMLEQSVDNLGLALHRLHVLQGQTRNRAIRGRAL